MFETPGDGWFSGIYVLLDDVFGEFSGDLSPFGGHAVSFSPILLDIDR